MPFPKEAVIIDGFDFIFFFSIHDVWGWPREVDTILGCFAIRSQQTSMKDVMNGPARGKIQPISHGGNSFRDFKRAMTFGGQFERLIREIKVLPFEPDSVANVEQTLRLGSGPFVDRFSCLESFSIGHFRCFFHSIIHGWGCEVV